MEHPSNGVVMEEVGSVVTAVGSMDLGRTSKGGSGRKSNAKRKSVLGTLFGGKKRSSAEDPMGAADDVEGDEGLQSEQNAPRSKRKPGLHARKLLKRRDFDDLVESLEEGNEGAPQETRDRAEKLLWVMWDQLVKEREEADELVSSLKRKLGRTEEELKLARALAPELALRSTSCDSQTHKHAESLTPQPKRKKKKKDWSYSSEVVLHKIVEASASQILEVKVDGYRCVVKRTNLNGATDYVLHRVQQEAAVYGVLPVHQNILRMLNSTITKSCSSLYMPKMDCDLTQYLTKHGPPPPAVAYAVATAVATAMEAVHLHGVIHRDLKGDNIFLSLDEENVPVEVVVGDFDTAVIASKDAPPTDCVGSPGFMAPEVLSAPSTGKPYDEACDVFSFGMLVYQLITGRYPYSELNPIRISKAVLNCDLPTFSDEQRETLPKLVQLHEVCITHHVAIRPTFAELVLVLKHMGSSNMEVRDVLASVRAQMSVGRQASPSHSNSSTLLTSSAPSSGSDRPTRSKSMGQLVESAL